MQHRINNLNRGPALGTFIGLCLIILSAVLLGIIFFNIIQLAPRGKLSFIAFSLPIIGFAFLLFPGQLRFQDYIQKQKEENYSLSNWVSSCNKKTKIAWLCSFLVSLYFSYCIGIYRSGEDVLNTANQFTAMLLVIVMAIIIIFYKFKNRPATDENPMEK